MRVENFVFDTYFIRCNIGDYLEHILMSPKTKGNENDKKLLTNPSHHFDTNQWC